MFVSESQLIPGRDTNHQQTHLRRVAHPLHQPYLKQSSQRVKSGKEVTVSDVSVSHVTSLCCPHLLKE